MATRKFAEGTTVPLERTLAEINTLLGTMDCTQKMVAEDMTGHHVAFTVGVVTYRISCPKPDARSAAFQKVKVNATSYRQATASEISQKVQQETARRMRALAALIKARLVAIEEGITTMERAFIGDIVVGKKGETLAETALPQIIQAIEQGKAPSMPMLPWQGNETK